MDDHSGVGRAGGIRKGVGMSHDALEHLLHVLEVGLPLLPSPVESRQPLVLGSLVQEDFLREEGAGCKGNKPRVQDGEAGSPGLPLCFLAAGNKFCNSWVFDPPGLHSLLESDDVNCLASRACCPKVIEDITESDVLEEDGFVFNMNHPRLFHSGEHKFLPDAIGGSDGRLEI